MKREAQKLYSSVFKVFRIPNVIKIHHYNFERHTKVGAFLRHSVDCWSR